VEEGDVAAEEVLRVREEVGAVGQGAEEVERRERCNTSVLSMH